MEKGVKFVKLEIGPLLSGQGLVEPVISYILSCSIHSPLKWGGWIYWSGWLDISSFPYIRWVGWIYPLSAWIRHIHLTPPHCPLRGEMGDHVLFIIHKVFYVIIFPRELNINVYSSKYPHYSAIPTSPHVHKI